MPPRAKKTVNKVDETVTNQENPGTSEKDRSVNEPEQHEIAKASPANAVDETVENQESPGKSAKDRGTTNSDPDEPEFAKMAPAQEVDVTVINQESLGAGEVKDRNPEPQLVKDSAGITYDVSKSSPELVGPESEKSAQRRARVRQNSGVLNAKDMEGFEDEEKSKNTLEIEFVESGLTAQGRVWRKGQILKLDNDENTRRSNADLNNNVWYELSADEQKERYGKVFFEKR